MGITPSDLQAFAIRLVTENSEVGYRTAASRAYYAAFHGCRNAAPAWSFDKDVRGSVHAALIQYLQNFKEGAEAQNTTAQLLAELLRKARNLRSIADYDLEEQFGEEVAAQNIAVADAILLDVSTLNRAT